MYSEDLADKICESISTGLSVKKACIEHGVSERSFFIWLGKHDYIVQQYTRARAIRADARFESSEQIMDDLRAGIITPDVARILFDEVKWKTGKESAMVYGDSKVIRGDASNPLVLQNKKPTPEQIEEALKEYGISKEIYEK